MNDDNNDIERHDWMYFRITGQINGISCQGAGRMPFTPVAREQYPPWLRLQMGDDLKIVDCGAEARIYNGMGHIIGRYDGNSFFVGLHRPWRGLSAIDSVRHDAMKQQMWSEAELLDGYEKAQVTCSHYTGTLVYTIDLEKDVLEKIVLSSNGHTGELIFSYVVLTDLAWEEFIEPRGKSYSRMNLERPGILWLLQLLKGNLIEKNDSQFQ
jgi:hypothetical protein